jgi:amino acid adenylation domain-containing protein
MNRDLGTEELLEAMRRRGIEITLEGDGLSVKAPRGALGEQEKRELAANRERLLGFLRDRRCEPAASSFPLTEIQQAYWVGRRSIALGNVGCHAYREFAAGEDLDIARLQAAWQVLIARHDMLRAVITDDGRQRILPEVAPYPIEVLDLRGRSDADAQLQALRARLSHRTFDPSAWPMFDIRVTRTDRQLHVHVGMDLLIADAASMLQLYREWSALYRDLAHPLPEVPARFADYVASATVSHAALAEAAAYWSPRLPTLPGAPELPLAAATAPSAHPHFTRHTRTLAPQLWAGLCERARAAGLTPANVLVAAYADILARWSRHRHFLITLTTFGAPAAYAGVVGDFTSTLLLEVDARPPTYIERARSLQSRLARDLDHAAWSGVRVMRELARIHQRLVDSIPVVFTSALGHRSGAEATLPLAWLGRTVHAITQTPQVWIDHHVIEDGDSLVASWDVLDGQFPQGMIEEMFAAHGRLLQALATGDAAWSSTLGDHLPPAQLERRRQANATAAPLPAGLLHDGFFAWAVAEPQRPAVVAADAAVSYGELAAHAAAVAHEVRKAGVGRNELVGVAMDKGWQQVAAVLGILAAGAAYLPIDPALPPARRRHLAQHGKLRVVLTCADEPVTDWPAGVAALALETLPRQSTLPEPLPGAQPSDLAYVLYTSGSTGEPKGVMIEHRAALNTIADVARRFGVGPADAVLGLSSLSFDLSVYDIFGLLGCGGRLVLPEPARLRDPGHWLALMQRNGVSVWNTVPALMSMLVEHGEHAADALRIVLLSGDWIPLSLPARVKAMAQNATVFALGGATEASIWSNWYEVRRIEPEWRSIPYGWPLANQSYHVLDDALEPAPDGVPGRLCIGGAGLARGYWDDAARTAQRFVRHPVSGERLYDTGDIGRYLPDGAIEFLGREDSQVKVRGHRIELGEIEARLHAHPAVEQALVLAQGERASERRLVAWVTTRPGADSHLAWTAPGTAEAAADARLLSDPRERLVWKLARHGLREPAAGAPRIGLPALAEREESWRRVSVRSFSQEPVALQALAALLGALSSRPRSDGIGPRHRYPSAGSAYCVQAWLHVKPGRVAAIEGGFYYYHPDRHDLEFVGADPLSAAALHVADNQAVFESSAFSLFLVSALEAMEPLYGEHARDLCLLEAGYMGQLLMQQAAASGLGLCAIGVVHAAPIAGALGLGKGRQLAHSFVGGLPGASMAAARADAPARDQDLSDELKRWSAQALPDYMVPDAVVLLDALPLTANGKIDRARLPDPLLTARPATLAPEGALEKTVATIFAEVLGKAEVGRDDVVFELGGTSVHVVRIHRRLVAELSVTVGAIDVVDVFRFPSVRLLSEHLSGLGRAAPPAADGAARAAARRVVVRQRGGGTAGGAEEA